MFSNEIAEFLLGKGIDEKYWGQAKQLLESPAGQIFKPMLLGMQQNIQKPPPGYYN